MHTHLVKLTTTLSLVFICLLTMQQASKAQWIDVEKVDYYSSEAQQFSTLSQSLDILEKADFAKDFQLALKKGEAKFLAIRGAGIAAPGVTDKQLADAYNNRGMGIKVLKGSNDTMPPALARRVAKVARDYMAPYNRLLLTYLSERIKRGKKQTPSLKLSKGKK